jgi:hypothetical protein
MNPAPLHSCKSRREITYKISLNCQSGMEEKRKNLACRQSIRTIHPVRRDVQNGQIAELWVDFGHSRNPLRRHAVEAHCEGSPGHEIRIFTASMSICLAPFFLDGHSLSLWCRNGFELA